MGTERVGLIISVAQLAKKPVRKRATCTCAAYRWPHRPGGGLCRWPDPPAGQHPTAAGTNRPTAERRRGLRRTLMRKYGMHPIRDRAVINAILPILHKNPRMYLGDALRLAGLCP